MAKEYASLSRVLGRPLSTSGAIQYGFPFSFTSSTLSCSSRQACQTQAGQHLTRGAGQQVIRTTRCSFPSGLNQRQG